MRVPQFPHERRSCPVAACSTPGGLGTTCARFGARRIPHRPFWAGCLSHFHPLLVTTPHTQVPRVSIGHRTGRSTAVWLAEAALLSAGFRPRRVPPRDACCVVLVPLSKNGSSMEQSFILLKGARQTLAETPKTLSDRVHACPCGLTLDRDVNAARNIQRLGLSRQAPTPPPGGVA